MDSFYVDRIIDHGRAENATSLDYYTKHVFRQKAGSYRMSEQQPIKKGQYQGIFMNCSCMSCKHTDCMRMLPDFHYPICIRCNQRAIERTNSN